MGMMAPLVGLRLLLPAILPSWRFFDTVAASPRLDFAILAGPDDEAENWQLFRPHPPVLTLATMLGRLLWNAQANEDLFLVSLAERLMKAETQATMLHSQRELLLRIARHLDRHAAVDRDSWLQLRLRLVRRADRNDQVESEIVYLSSPWPLTELRTR